MRGQDIYGQYPVVGVDQANDLGAGRLIPTTSVEQYAGTLARWFGLSDGQVKTGVSKFRKLRHEPVYWAVRLKTEARTGMPPRRMIQPRETPMPLGIAFLVKRTKRRAESAGSRRPAAPDPRGNPDARAR